jgi:hypothetical protein
MDIPRTPEEAYEHTERNAAWVRKRHPDALVRQVVESVIASPSPTYFFQGKRIVQQLDRVLDVCLFLSLPPRRVLLI